MRLLRSVVIALCLAVAAALLPLVPAGAHGSLALIPQLTCVRETGPTTFEAHFVARNDEATPLVVGFGSNNIVMPAPFFRGQPENFAVGETPWVTPSIPKTDYLEWTLGDVTLRAEWTAAPRCLDEEAVDEQPTIVGDLQAGRTIAIAGERPVLNQQRYDVTFTWQTACNTGSPVTVGSARSYSLTNADVGAWIRGRVRYEDPATGDGVTLETPCSGPVVAAAVVVSPPVSMSTAHVVGTATVGETLTLAGGSWSGAISESVRWESCDARTCTTVGSAPSYQLTVADVGRTVRAVVTGWNAGGSSQVTTAAVGPVASGAVAPQPTAVAHVVGTPQTGTTLSLAGGSWSGTAPLDEAVLWESCTTDRCTRVGIGPTYVPVEADLGRTIRAVVQATNAAGSASVTTPPTGPVVAPPPAVLTLSPGRVFLGMVAVGTLGEEHPIRIRNTGGSPLTINGVELRGNHREDFRMSADCPKGTVLAPGESCRLSVQMKPSAPTPRTALLVVTSTAPGGPKTVALTGRGIRRHRA